MQRRTFIRQGLSAAFIAAFPELFSKAFAEAAPKAAANAAKGLTAGEEAVVKSFLAAFGEVNPIDPATKARKFISFGFLTDIHKCRRVEGDDVPEFGKCRKDYYYWGDLTESEPTIRTLGAVAKGGGLDGIFFGGDFSTGNSAVPLTDQEYVDEIAAVRALFDAYFGKTPFFCVDGNHDRCYKTQHVMDDAAWAKVLPTILSDVKANPDIAIAFDRDLKHPTMGKADEGKNYTGSSYHVDFTRLLKTGGKNVRMAVTSLYDRGPGCASILRQYDAAQFYDSVTKELIDPRLTPENTVLGLTAHDAQWRAAEMIGSGFLKAGQRYGNSTCHAQFNHNLGAHKGGGFFGMVAGHLHQSRVVPIKNFAASCVQVSNAFVTARSTKVAKGAVLPPGAFSVFTVDTENLKLHETRCFNGKVDNRFTGIAV